MVICRLGSWGKSAWPGVMRWMVRERGFVSIVAIVGSGTRDGRILARDWDLGVVVGGGVGGGGLLFRERFVQGLCEGRM